MEDIFTEWNSFLVKYCPVFRDSAVEEKTLEGMKFHYSAGMSD